MPAAYEGILTRQLLCLESQLMCLNSNNFLNWRLQSSFYDSGSAVPASLAMDQFIFIHLWQSVGLLAAPRLGFTSSF